MYKNQLQELAQRSCFNLPSYSCIREGPDHAPRFKATVNFNGELFDSPNYCNTLRQAEHAAAEVALNTLSRRGPSRSLAARIWDETGVCKNLLQETAQRANVPLPFYTTTRSGPGHMPVFTCVVEVAGMTFHGEAAKTKKQAEKNAAMAAWSAMKLFARQVGGPHLVPSAEEMSEEQEQIIIARGLSMFYEKSASAAAASAQQSSRTRSPTVLAQFRESGSSSPQRYAPGHAQLVSRSGLAFCSMANAEVRGGGAIPTRIRRSVQDVAVPVEEHQRDEEEWLRGGSEPQTVSSSNSSSSSQESNRRNPVFYTRAGSHWSQTDSSILSRALAPPVRVRSVVAVSAAPPERQRPQPREADKDVADLLSRLELR